MRYILLTTILFLFGYSYGQKNRGYFGKKNFVSVGVNPTFDFKMQDLLGIPLYLEGNKVEQMGAFTFRTGGINLGYGRALSNKALVGVAYRRANFDLHTMNYSPDGYMTSYIYDKIPMKRTQASVYVEFSSFDWNSLMMGNFMNRIEVGYDMASFPTGDFQYASFYDIDQNNEIDPILIQTGNFEDFVKPDGYRNGGVFFRYSAMQAVPLSESLIWRYGFDVSYYLGYARLFREFSYSSFDDDFKEENYRNSMDFYKLYSFRSIINFRTELIFAF